MENHSDFEPFFSQKDDMNFEEYYEQMAEDGTWIYHCEIYAASMVTQTNIHVHYLKGQVSQIYNIDSLEIPTLHVSFHDGNHYNSFYFINNNANAYVAPILLEDDNQITGHNDQDPIKFILDEKGCKDTNKSCIEDKLLKIKDKP